MTFWIYNFGLAVPVGEQNLKVRANVNPLAKSAKSAGIHSSEDETEHQIEHQIQKSPIAQPPSSPNLYQKAARPTKGQSRHQIFIAEQVMSTPVISLRADTNISSAWQQFKQKRFRHFTVVDQDDRLIGIISDRDILLEAADNGTSIHKARNIGQIMHKRVLTGSPDTHIREVCRVMFSQHIGALPITTQSGKVAGIITRSDILRTMVQHEPVELWI